LGLLIRKERVMKIRQKIGVALLVIGFLGLIVPGLEAVEIKVKCDKGQSVQSALDALTGPATITVTGTCHENVVIRQDDVTLQGGTYVGPDGATQPTQHAILVQGARRVLIKGVTVGGAGNGVVAHQGGSLTLESSSIQGNGGNGVVASFGSVAVVNSCTIQDNTDGVVATANSSLLVMSSTIAGNRGTGVNVNRGSSARIGANFWGYPYPNTIEYNTTGISVFQASQAMIVNNTIQNNTRDGVLVEGASARLTGNSIKYNWKGIEVTSAGNARIGINDDGSAGIGNIIESNQLEGISIGNGGAAYMLKNQIRYNGQGTGRAGVGIYRANGRLVGDNIIEGNGGHGVEVDQAALFQGIGDWNLNPGRDIIQQNGRSGISAWNTSSLDIRNVTVTGNAQNGIAVSLRSALRIYDATVSDNQLNGIALYDGSWVARYGGDSPRDSITGNTGWGIACYGGNLIGVTSGIEGNNAGEVNCPPIIIPPPPVE
jgi:parallel beta-helix repeat protein